ncbi:NAD-dependent epimerase/dehydratase family protein [Fulvitalea axinellae]
MIVLTGATGVIGKHILRNLVNRGHRVRCMLRPGRSQEGLPDYGELVSWQEASLFDPSDLENLLNGAEKVIHSAGFVSFLRSDRDNLFKTNVEGTANLVNACLDAGIKKLVHLSSIAALGSGKKSGTVDEKAKWEEDNASAYAHSKRLAEQEVWRAEAEGLSVAVVNPSVVLTNEHGDRSSAELNNRMLAKKSIYPKGDMNYVDVRDVAEIVSQLVESDISGERFVLSAGKTSFSELRQLFVKFSGLQKPKNIELGSGLMGTGAMLANIAAVLRGKTAPYAIGSIKNIGKCPLYDSSKVSNALGVRFRGLDESLSWICESLQRGSETVSKKSPAQR